MDAALKRYVERRREEIESVLPCLREAQERARSEGDERLVKDIAEYLEGDEFDFSLLQFPSFQAWVLEDVLWLAERLMAERRCRSFLERAGLHGDLTEEEETWLRYYALESLAVHRGWSGRDLSVAGAGAVWPAAALVRRVLTGIHPDLRTEEAFEFLEYNIHYKFFYERMKQQSPISNFPPHVDEVLFIARGLIKTPRIIRLKETIFERDMIRGREVVEFLDHIYDRYLKKYGWTSKLSGGIRVPVSVLVGRFVRLDHDIHDSVENMKVLEGFISDSFCGWLLERDKYIRTWGPSHVIENGDGG